MFDVTIFFDSDKPLAKSFGTNFTFSGKLSDGNVIELTSDHFNINQTENEYNTLIYYSLKESCCVNELTGVHFECSGNIDRDNQLNVTGESFKVKFAKTPEIQRMHNVPGVICFSFRKSPYDFCISTTTQYVYGLCEGEWLNRLNKYVKDLNITQLYVVGRNQKKIIENFVVDVPIYVWKRPMYKMQMCSKCARFGCAQYKAKCLLSDIFMQLFLIQCEK